MYSTSLSMSSANPTKGIESRRREDRAGLDAEQRTQQRELKVVGYAVPRPWDAR